MPALGPSRPCPCTSGAPYGDCCRPLHQGAVAPSAERLMRSRYAAFAVGDAAYLARTLHPDHEDAQAPPNVLEAHLRDAIRRHRYMGLTVIDAREGDETAEVLFFARVFAGGKDLSFVELSSFARVAGEFRYRSGQLRSHGARKPLPTGLTIDAAREWLSSDARQEG